MKAPLIIALGLMMFLAANGLWADPLNQWTWRFPYPQGSTLVAVTYGGGQFVAVGDNGSIISSADGYNWTSQTYDVFPYLRGVAYADGEYAAVGDGGIILISSNAVTWTQMPSVTTNSLRGIAGDSTWRAEGVPQFMAVGDSGIAVQCSNGTNWSVIASDTSNALFSVTCLDTDYIAIGNAGTVTIYDSSAFSRNSPASVGTTNNLYGVASSPNGVVAAVGDLYYSSYGSISNGILYSLDYGYDWKSQLWGGLYGLPNFWFPSSYFVLHGAADGTSGFVAVGDTGHTLEFVYPGVVFTSTNGSSWLELPNSTSENRLYGCTYGNGLYVLVGDAGGIVVSSNLVNWTEVTGYHRSAITAIACKGNLCIASALPSGHVYSSFADFTALVSTNGTGWSVSSANTPAMADLTTGGGMFVGVSGNGIYTTTDGYNWQTNGSFPNSFYGVCYANGQFVAVGDSGSIFQSTDGMNWNNCSIATSGSFSCVAFGNGVYVAAGPFTATSSDGITWSLCSTNAPTVITRIIHGEGLFVATAYVGRYYNGSYYNDANYSGEILTSQDGINWQVQFTSPGGSFSGIAYSGGTFLTISIYGAMFKSSDGTNWSRTAFNLPVVDSEAFSIYYNLGNLSVYQTERYATVCADNGTFLAAGLDGTMVQSGNTWNPALISASQATTNGFTFSYNQQIDVPYHIQTSSNLLNWADVYNGTGTGQRTNFTYSAFGNSRAQFFRIVSP